MGNYKLSCPKCSGYDGACSLCKGDGVIFSRRMGELDRSHCCDWREALADYLSRGDVRRKLQEVQDG